MTIKHQNNASGKETVGPQPRSLTAVLGADLIRDTLNPFVDYMETAIAAFESDGTLIGEILTGNSYCRLLVEAVDLDTDEPNAVYFSGFCRQAVLDSVFRERGRESVGAGMGIRVEPIFAFGEALGVIIGAISVETPDEAAIRRASELTGADFKKLSEAAKTAPPKSDHMHEAARAHISRLAGTIGHLYEETIEKEQANAEAVSRLTELAAARELDFLLLASMDEGVYTCDRDFKFTYLNPAAERITGYSREEILGSHVSSVIPEDQLEKMEEMIQRCLAGHGDRYDLEIIRKDGRRIVLSMTVSPMFEKGEVVGSVGVVVDITDRRLLQDRLETQNRRLNLLQSVVDKSVSELPHGNALKTLAHEVAETFGYKLCNIFMPNSGDTKLQIVASHGYEDDYIKSLNAGDSFDYEYQEALETPLIRAFRNGRQGMMADINKDSRERNLVQSAKKHGFKSVAATPLEYRGERLGALVVYSSEVHEFDEEELSLLSTIAAQASVIAGNARVYYRLTQSEERYRELYNTAADWMYTLDSDGVIRECNDTMTRILGVPKEKIIGTYIHDYEAGADREKARADLAGFRKRSEVGMTFTAEREFITASGNLLVIEVHAIAQPGSAGEEIQWRVVGRDITEKKEIDARMNLLAAAVDNTHECVIISDLNGDIISINDAGAALFSRKAEEMTGTHMGELWADQNPVGLRQEIYEKTLDGGWEGQMWYKRSDDSTFPVFSSSACVKGANGKPIALVGISRDISVEQRMTTEILRRNRELAVLNAVATTSAASLDLDSTLQSAINSLVESMGYDCGILYLLNDKGNELTPRAFQGAPSDMLEKLASIKVGEGYAGAIAATSKPFFVEDTPDNPNRLPGLTDEAWFTSLGGVPLVSKDTLLGVMLVGVREQYNFDSNERLLLASVGRTIGVAIENARLFDDVARGKNEWETTFDAMTNGVSIHDLDYNIIRANEALAKILGTTSAELVGKKCYDIFHGSLGPPTSCPQEKVFADGASHSVVLEEPRLGRIINVASDPIFDAEGNIIGAVHDVRDITEQEHLREQLSQSEKIRALGEMAGGVAHDFNNFLTVILGNTQLLLAQQAATAEDGEIRASLESVQRAAADAAETVRRIQEFTRVRTTRSFTTVDINKVVWNAIDVARPRWRDEADAHGVKINIVTEYGEVPPVNGNEAELGEVLVNLILNAADALPGGGVINLVTAIDEGGEWIMVTVTDDGDGMDEDMCKRIFEPFFSTKGVGGSGLGLSVAYGIVKRHGGDIIVRSQKGKGTRFTVSLPVATVADLTAAYGQEEEEEPLRRAKVLVIDDAPMIRTLMGDMLEKLGQSYETAGGGVDGMDMFDAAIKAGEPFDLVLTDLGMPEMSGWEVVEAVKSRSVKTPVALITGWGDQLDSSKMTESQVDAVIAKPFRVEDIRRLLAKALA